MAIPGVDYDKCMHMQQHVVEVDMNIDRKPFHTMSHILYNYGLIEAIYVAKYSSEVYTEVYIVCQWEQRW